MHETMEKVKELCELKKCFMEYLMMIKCNSEPTSAEEVGMWVDMVKDMCEAEKDVWKACYYKKMVEGMEPPTEEEIRKVMERMQQGEDGPRGYDNWKYASGRFAPTGHGHMAGYMMDEEMYPPEMWDVSGYSGSGTSRGNSAASGSGRSGNQGGGRSGNTSSGQGTSGGSYGYSDGNSRGSGGNSNNGSGNGSYGYSNGRSGMTDRYGRAFAEWEDSKRHYTQSNSKEDKEAMDMHAKEHVRDATHSIKEMWKHGDPELKKEIKKELTAVVAEMPT